MDNKNSFLKNCLVCEGENFRNFLEVKDYFLSGETFKLIQCLSCSTLFTLPRPEAEAMGSYYKSKEYLSHNSKKSTIKDFLYRQARKFALSNKLSMIEKFISPGRVLDFGAGTGEFLNDCKKKGWDTLGFEPNDQASKRAIAEYGLQMLEKNQLQQIQQESLDVITLWHVLEHTEDPLKEMKFFHPLLKENGLLILALPNYESWDALHYGHFWAAYDVPRHLYHFSRKSVGKLSERAGFRIREIRPLRMDAYYISLLSEKYISGKNNYYKAWINGWRSNFFARKGNTGYSSWVYILSKS